MSQSNIFEAGAAEVPMLFGDYLEGPVSESGCLALAVSTRKLASPARNAIEKSLGALGLGACTYATLYPHDEESEGGEIALDGQSLFLVVEGLDPLRLIVADEQALNLLGQAYRTAYEPDSALRIFGRTAVAFADLGELVSTDDGKQRAWALFKTLA